MNKVRKCLPFTLTGAHVSVFVTPSSNLISVGLHDPLCKELFKILFIESEFEWNADAIIDCESFPKMLFPI
jgi:hypothetical protein